MIKLDSIPINRSRKNRKIRNTVANREENNKHVHR